MPRRTHSAAHFSTLVGKCQEGIVKLNAAFNACVTSVDFTQSSKMHKEASFYLTEIEAQNKVLISLKTKYYGSVGRENRQYRGKSLTELMQEASLINLHKTRLYSAKGREIKILDFKMYKASPKEKNTVDAILVDTPAKIALRLVQGFKFNAEFQAISRGYQYNNVLTEHEQKPNNVELTKLVAEYLSKHKNTIRVIYLDSSEQNAYNIKLGNIYVLNKPKGIK